MERPSREKIHMATATMWGLRSCCKRPNRKVGCVITSSDMRRILAIGYNGPPRPMPNDSCLGSKAQGYCGCIHAEVNAIAMVDSTIPNKRMFVSMSPCMDCARIILQCGISHIYFGKYYRNNEALPFLTQNGIMVCRQESPNPLVV
jgi:dCMP deaminase